MNNEKNVPTQAELLQRNGVLLVLDEIQPPSGPVPKGKEAVLKPKETGLFIALLENGRFFAFNGHVDLGTGIKTSLAQVVCEELDLRMDQLQMVLGDTARVPNQGATIASATLQISAIPLRKAAAEARRWLLAKAAERFGTDASSLQIAEGRIHTSTGDSLGFEDLIRGQHIELQITDDAPLKPLGEYRLVGKSTTRVDIPGKATGELTFVHDMRVPGMLHGRVVRPPYDGYDTGPFVGTSLISVDESSIAHIPGIVAVVVIKDFIGIVAEREEQAAKAARELHTNWKPWTHLLPDLSDVEQAIRNNEHIARVVHDTGGVDQALETVATRLTRKYIWPYQLHGSIGPSCALADYTPELSRVWSGSQNPHMLQADLAWLIDVDESKIEVIRMEASGCYGRNCADDVCADALLLSRAVGKPVRVQLTREQEHVWEPKGTAQLMEVDGGIDAAGNLAVYDFETSYPSNGAPNLALLLTGRIEPVPVMYEMGDRTSVPHYQYPELRVTINDMAPILRASWLRGVSALPNVFAHESYIDELASAAGVDPVEYRLRFLPDERAAELVRATAERAGWTPRTKPFSTPSEEGMLRGRGFAYARYIHSKFPGFGAAWAAWVADVAINKTTGDVAVTRVVVGHDAGMMINPAGVQHQIHGNVIQSTSRVLKEQVTFEESKISSKEWGGYPILTFPELPPVDVMMIPRQEEPPMGSGESASVPSAAAIANAIYDATGIRFRELPITPEKVLAALRDNQLAGSQDPVGLPYAAPPKAKWKKGWLGGLAGVLGVAMSVALTASPWRPEIARVAPPNAGTWSAATLERGRQLAAAGDCAVCHTAPNGKTNAGGLVMETPFGKLYSTNITPDPETGIGNWSYGAFERAMRQGISRDGKHLYPAFPYTAFRNITESDMQALYGYLMSQPAVKNTPPANSMSFPFNIRPLMSGWNALFLQQGEYKADATQSEQWNRGNYLVNGLGHCAACHSPRNLMGAEKTGTSFLKGAVVDGWEAPALAGLSTAAVPWSEEQLYQYMKTGFSDGHGVAAGPMGPVVAEMATLPDSDLRAIANYLISLPGESGTSARTAVVSKAEARVPNLAAGKRIFEGACLGCHSAADQGPVMFGVSPDIAVNSAVHSDRPNNLIKTILFGIENPPISSLGYMPAFKSSFNDSQIADLVAYIRSEYAPSKPVWPELSKQISWQRANPGTH
ncbi:molybdopterin-dependent oxidoreductase (plasmid) [Pseudomonas sp. BYT-5]|uniref:molybdopterin cofactor-binding domain-containing protein n=1 Tax=Pseudomonas sp. BYT-5 TaxID=2944392 RepID=UPI0020218045|nr:molybdopterin cofactor-binding domain-containing protein [Pseudomonas sp. BYT-5]URD45382.1 molybdopterin-dependent oxidoreductase [Pseudomonas sp. BYT-5]